MARSSKAEKRRRADASAATAPPPTLIALHARIGAGKALLGRLLQADSMRRSWATLKRLVESDAQWERIWGDIRTALTRARNQGPAPSQIRDDYHRTAKLARALATRIENDRLNVMGYELLPDDVMQINGVRDWAALDPRQRSQAAHRLLKQWPSTSEMLEELAGRADDFAAMATRAPRLRRRWRNSALTAFVRILSGFFNERFAQPLYGTVAAIASIVFEQNVEKDFVAKAVKRRKGGH